MRTRSFVARCLFTLVAATAMISIARPVAIMNDFEYFVEATIGQQKLVFPATGAALPQTVVMSGK